MFVINADKSIYLTRGDIAAIEVSANTSENASYVFKSGDKVRFRVTEKGRLDEIVLTKDVTIETETSVVTINLDNSDTKIGELINKPKDYWYEVELNPDTLPQTFIGYDADGPKIFRLFPEGVGGLMGVITVNATANLSANGNSTATGSITWSVPSLPDDVSQWDSVVISGSWSWNGKGNIREVIINGTSTSVDTPFSINLNTSTAPPISITCQGGNKNATGANFAWSDLVVTYSYTDPASGSVLHVKVNGTWIQASEVYKKINGSWVLLEDLESAVESNMNYVRG